MLDFCCYCYTGYFKFFFLYFWAKRIEIEWWRLQTVRDSVILFALALHFSLTKIVAFVVCKQRSGSMLTFFRFKMHLWGGVVLLELAAATVIITMVVVVAVVAMNFLLIIFCKSSAVHCILHRVLLALGARASSLLSIICHLQLLLYRNWDESSEDMK